MMRSLALFALALPLAPLAQPAPEAASPEAIHTLPFASGGHAIELDGAPEAIRAGAEAVRVEVQSAPTWVAFEAPEAEAEIQDGVPLARLAFGVTREAPIGEVGEIRLTVVSAGGEVVGEKTIRVEASPPEAARLGLPRPNPSRGEVTLDYEVPLASAVRLVVVDVLGREVAVLASGEVAPGAHEAQIPADALAAGVYAVVLSVDRERRQRQVQRLTVVR